MFDLLLRHLFLCYSGCVQSVMDFFMVDENVFLLLN